jgi:uncharacterized cupredoxin-like copper-binding protein
MSDAMRFVPGSIEVREGDTVRFVVANDGKLMHELVLGTKRELDTHAGAMARSSNITHDQPYMVHVPPGKSGDLVWTSNRAGRFDFACLVPGHSEAGMVGSITVIAR